MKWIKKIILFFICSLSVLEILPIQASTVSYESNRYTFDVYVVGSGALQVEGRYIKGYERLKLEEGESITLSIKADAGSKVSSIYYNGNYLQSENLSKITHVQGKKAVTLTVVFIKENTQEPIPPLPPITPPLKPDPPTAPVEPPKKEIIADTIITKDIPMDAIKNGISDEFLRGYIQSSRDYVILSHNVIAKPGTYTIRIELDNGEQRTLKIKVVDVDEKSPTIKKDKDYYPLIILALLILYSIYMHSKIKRLQKMEEK